MRPLDPQLFRSNSGARKNGFKHNGMGNTNTSSHYSRRQKNEDARQVDKDFHEEGGSELLSSESPGALNMHDKVQSQEDMEHVANDNTQYGSIFN